MAAAKVCATKTPRNVYWFIRTDEGASKIISGMRYGVGSERFKSRCFFCHVWYDGLMYDDSVFDSLQ